MFSRVSIYSFQATSQEPSDDPPFLAIAARNQEIVAEYLRQFA